jgi:hypothetical protein
MKFRKILKYHKLTYKQQLILMDESIAFRKSGYSLYSKINLFEKLHLTNRCTKLPNKEIKLLATYLDKVDQE